MADTFDAGIFERSGSLIVATIMFVCPGYYNPKNPADVTETLKEITGGGSHFLSLLFFGIGVLAILFALIRVWAVITLI